MTETTTAADSGRMAGSLTAADLLPKYDAREVHQIAVAAPAEVTLDAARRVTPADAPLLRWLLRLRGVRVDDTPVWQTLARLGFVPAGAHAIVVVGRPWRLRGSMRPVEDFAAFAVPGWAKVALDLRAVDGRLVTETRVRCTDAAARRRFRIYWLAVGIGSRLVRRSWLRAARRRAEASCRPAAGG